jgi:hypothetical protein
MVPLCITIRARRAGPTTCRASDILFSSEDVLHRVFAALVGQQSNSVGLDIYLFGIVDSGLHFAHVHGNAIKDPKAYKCLEPTRYFFAGASRRPGNDNLSSIYLAGNFSSGAILHNPLLKTFLRVYFNDKANLTLKPLLVLESYGLEMGNTAKAFGRRTSRQCSVMRGLLSKFCVSRHPAPKDSTTPN